METSNKGAVGKLEVMKRLTAEDLCVSSPHVDKGIDVMASDGEKCYNIEVKTCIFQEDQHKSLIAAAGKGKTLSEDARNSDLVVVKLDSDLDLIEFLVFKNEEIPDVKTLRVIRNSGAGWMYSEYIKPISYLFENK